MTSSRLIFRHIIHPVGCGLRAHVHVMTDKESVDDCWMLFHRQVSKYGLNSSCGLFSSMCTEKGLHNMCTQNSCRKMWLDLLIHLHRYRCVFSEAFSCSYYQFWSVVWFSLQNTSKASQLPVGGC